MEKNKAILRPKSWFQKEDCLFCEKNSTQEACYAEGITHSTIRCCETPACVEAALDMAVYTVEMCVPQEVHQK